MFIPLTSIGHKDVSVYDQSSAEHMHYQKEIGTEFEMYFALSVKGTRVLREKQVLRIQRSKTEMGKNVESERIFTCEEKQGLGQKGTTFRSYRRGNWSE